MKRSSSLPMATPNGSRKSRFSTGRVTLLVLIIVVTYYYIRHEDPDAAAERLAREALNRRCETRHVYVYDLPNKFNKDLVSDCLQLSKGKERCRELENWGFGQQYTPSKGKVFVGINKWWATHPHSLEVIFHRRMQNHPCIVSNPDNADLFYLPFYPALDMEKHLWNGMVSKQVVDKLALDFAQWVESQPAYKRYDGRDHFFILGSPTWSFRRLDRINDTWGSKMEYIPQIENMWRLEVERHPWSPGNSMGIPYPTAFHPYSDDDVLDWQMKVKESQRTVKFSYVASGSIGGDEAVKEASRNVVKQCSESTSCEFINCTVAGKCAPGTIMEMYMKSEFSIQPKGESFTKREMFDSLLGGSIPVFLWKDSAYSQYLWHLPADPESYSVFIPHDDLPNWTKIEDSLNKLTDAYVREMRQNIINLIPNLLYSDPEGEGLEMFKDAVDVALEGLSREVVLTKKSMQPKVKGSIKSKSMDSAEDA